MQLIHAPACRGCYSASAVTPDTQISVNMKHASMGLQMSGISPNPKKARRRTDKFYQVASCRQVEEAVYRVRDRPFRRPSARRTWHAHFECQVAKSVAKSLARRSDHRNHSFSITVQPSEVINKGRLKSSTKKVREQATPIPTFDG